MKIIQVFIASMLLSITSYGNPNFNGSPQLQVIAKSGLKLRIMPEMDAPVIAVIPYGSKIEVIQDDSQTTHTIRVDWVEGNWIKIKNKGQVGFIFDGFVSPLNVPLNDSEFSSEINNLANSLYSWAYINYQFLNMDTLSSDENSVTTEANLAGNKLLVHNSEQLMKVEFTLSGIRIMDAYHLLESMMDTRSNRSILKENSIFFEDAKGKVNKVKIRDGLITITSEDNHVKISCQSIIEGC